MTNSSDRGQGRSTPTSAERYRRDCASTDDWSDRHARTAVRDDRTGCTLTARPSYEERDWQARHGHVARLAEEQARRKSPRK